MSQNKEEPLGEPLILKTVGTKGYLKFPKAFTQRYNFDRDSLPNPVAKLEPVGDRVRLIYEWNEKDLRAAASQAKENRDAKKREK